MLKRSPWYEICRKPKLPGSSSARPESYSPRGSGYFALNPPDAEVLAILLSRKQLKYAACSQTPSSFRT